MIRNTKHTIKFSNTGKKEKYAEFVAEYRRVLQIYVDYMWTANYQWENKKGKVFVMDILHNKLEHPPYFDYNLIPVKTSLYARALCSCSNQACGIIGSTVEKQRKRLYMLDKMLAKLQLPSDKFIENLANGVPVKPNCSNVNPELSSKCANFIKTNGEFNGFLELKCIGDHYGNIRIPIKFTKVSNKWKKVSKLLGSFLLCQDNVKLRWKYEKPMKKRGREVGADQGKKTVLTLSDGQVTPKQDKHGHTLETIIESMAKKKKGSKAFKKKQDQRLNFINWSINQLNFKKIKEVKLEEIVNINYGKRAPRYLTHWMNTLIRNKVSGRCEELGVQVSLQSSAYRSQRCSCCGMVCKSHRKGKQYICSYCGNIIDADLNAAKNHEVDLPDVPKWLRNSKYNRKGFFWKSDGFYALDGSELRVPASLNKVNI